MTSAGAGGPTISQLVMLVSFSTRLMYRSSRGVNMAMAVPALLALPVRPERCRKDSTSYAQGPRPPSGLSTPHAGRGAVHSYGAIRWDIIFPVTSMPQAGLVQSGCPP